MSKWEYFFMMIFMIGATISLVELEVEVVDLQNQIVALDTFIGEA